MPTDFNFRDDDDENDAAAPTSKLPLKKKRIERPSADVIHKATQVGEEAGFPVRATRTADATTIVSDTREESPRPRKKGRPKGPRSQRVTYDLHYEDVEAFKDICDEELGGVTYKEGFRMLLEAYRNQPTERE